MTTFTENPFAVIYPVPSKFASRILDQNKSIFVKYATYDAIPKRLFSCKKIIIYESGSGKAITGECDILAIECMTPSEVLSEYEDCLFLSRDELITYSKGRDKKGMLVFKIHNINKYPQPKTLDHSLTMAGEYISEGAYQKLMN